MYGEDWPTQRTNLIKYWVKHVSCRAAEIGLEIPLGVREYLDDPHASGPPPHIGLLPVVQQTVLKLRLEDGFPPGSFMGPARGYNVDGQLAMFESHIAWSWFRVSYRFDITNPIGVTAFEDDLVVMQLEFVPWDELEDFRAE